MLETFFQIQFFIFLPTLLKMRRIMEFRPPNPHYCIMFKFPIALAKFSFQVWIIFKNRRKPLFKVAISVKFSSFKPSLGSRYGSSSEYPSWRSTFEDLTSGSWLLRKILQCTTACDRNKFDITESHMFIQTFIFRWLTSEKF